jgi:hypothetical protein
MFGIILRSSAAAEKSHEGMALKIRTGAEDMPDGYKHIETTHMSLFPDHRFQP